MFGLDRGLNSLNAF